MNYHQKNTKYCIEKQGITTGKNYTCNYCNKKIASEKRLKTHYSVCEDYNIKCIEIKYSEQLNQKNILILKHEETIKILQNKLENIALKAIQRPTTTNNIKTHINTLVQKMEPLSEIHLGNHTTNLTLEHVKRGAYGYAEYALEYPLKDRIACVDYSRRKIKFKDTTGNIVTDPEMVKLAPMFFESIKNKSSELVHALNTTNMDSVMFEHVATMFNINSDVKNGSVGIKTNFYHDFIKHVCSGSVY